MSKTTEKSSVPDAPIGPLLNVNEPRSTERELIIEIHPRDYLQWRGSSSQLQAEGLIPADFQWPECRGASGWSADGFDYRVQRCRPAGMKGSMRQWTRGDYWSLRREPSLRSEEVDAQKEIYEKQCALADVLWRQTPAAHVQRSLFRQAGQDVQFQSFKALLTAAPA